MTAQASFKSPTIQLYPDGRMDTRNASLYTGLAEKTLAMMRCNGTGPQFVKRGRVFYFIDDLNAWLADARYSSTAQAANCSHQVA